MRCEDCRLPIANWNLPKEANRKSIIANRQLATFHPLPRGVGHPVSATSGKASLLQFELILQSANRYLELAGFYNGFIVGSDK